MTDTSSSRTAKVVTTLCTGGLLGAAIGFAANFMSVQESVCGIGGHGVSDFCGRFGIGGRPTREERVDWAARPLGDCDALRGHVAAYPTGAYRSEAADLLAAREESVTVQWTPEVRTLPLSMPGYDVTDTRETAQQETRERVIALARQQCEGFAITTRFRLRGTRTQLFEWDCETRSDGVACAWQGQAVCDLNVRVEKTVETCG